MRTLLVAALLSISTIPAFAQAPTPRISVTGDATVYVQPDKILITLGVETWDQKVEVAKDKNNKVMADTVAGIKALGVAEKDIQTDQLSIEPRWQDSYERKSEAFIGYFVRNTLAVTLTDISKVEDLVTNVLNAGVNYIHGINFESTEFKKHREEAREMALKAAKEKAEKMAAVLDEKLGPVLEIQEHGGMPSYNSNWNGWGGGRGYAMAQNAIAVQEGPADNSPTIALGKIAISVSVSVAFELKRN